MREGANVGGIIQSTIGSSNYTCVLPSNIHKLLTLIDLHILIDIFTYTD